MYIVVGSWVGGGNGGRGLDDGGRKATECTTETDSKSKTTKFFFAIKINIHGWGLTKTGGRGAPKELFFGRGVKSYVTIKPRKPSPPSQIKLLQFPFHPDTPRRTLIV